MVPRTAAGDRLGPRRARHRQLAGDALDGRRRRPARAARRAVRPAASSATAPRRRQAELLELPFWLSIGALSLLQALLVAAPPPAVVAAGQPQSTWWALSLPLPIAPRGRRDRPRLGLRRLPHLPRPDRGAAPGGAGAGFDRPWRAARLAFLVGAAVRARLGSPGDASAATAAATALSALACTTLGWLLVCVVPPRWLKLGIYAMAVIDVYFVSTDLLQQPNGVLNAVAPAADLPKPPAGPTSAPR